MISAVVLTHNDEAIIGECLERLRWCDEIVVVDDYSTDKTADLAKKSGVTVYQHKLDDNFTEQRNFGLSKAKGEWVLFVDSDERVNGQLAKEIQSAVKTDKVGFYIKRRDFIFGQKLTYGEQGKMKLLRLAKKDAGIWERPVHEVWNIYGNVGELFTPIEHFPHQNVAQFLDDINRYSTLNARYLFSERIPVQWWHIPGYPVAKFFRNYFWYFGFLDGTAGIIVSLFMSFHSFLTRAKLWQFWDQRA